MLMHMFLQGSDMRYLIDTIWRNQSIISEDSRLDTLFLVRWDASVPLSPWNCVLLTADEVAAHKALPDPARVYGTALLNRVQQRHLMARTHFGLLA